VTPNITIGQAKDMRSDLGRGTGGSIPLTGRDMKAVYGSFTDQLRAAVDAISGEGAFDAANTPYREIMGKGGLVERLLPIGGGEKPRTGATVAGMTPGAASSMVTQGMRGGPGEGNFGSFVADVPPELAGTALGNHLQTLGVPVTAGNDFSFSPQKFAREADRIMPESRDLWDRTAPGARGRIEDVTTSARAYDLPPQASGLSKALGAIASISRGGGILGNIPGAVTAAIPWTVGKALESNAMIESLAGRYMTLMDRLRQSGGAPIAAASTSQQ
jgi:hypothetical protein